MRKSDFPSSNVGLRRHQRTPERTPDFRVLVAARSSPVILVDAPTHHIGQQPCPWRPGLLAAGLHGGRMVERLFRREFHGRDHLSGGSQAFVGIWD